MKKFLSAILIIILAFIPATQSHIFAQTTVAAISNKGILKDVQYTTEKEYEVVRLTIDGFSGYTSMELEDPLRIVIDLKSTQISGKQRTVDTKGALVNRVRYAQFTQSTTRVVLDVNEGYDFSIETTKTGLAVHVTEKKTPEELNDGKAILFSTKLGIRYMNDGSNDSISLTLGRYDGYSVSRLTGPDRLVLTIPDARIIAADQQVLTGADQIQSISYKKTGKTGAIITLGLNGQYQYSFKKSEDALIMTVQVPTYKNISYHSNSDRIYFTLENAALTKGDKDLMPLYKAEYNEKSRQYTVTFPSDQADLGEGVLDINDSYLKSFEVRQNTNDNTTSLIFTSRSKNSYLVYTRNSGTTAITVVKPAADNKKLVVIDAGHGGSAIGTAYGKLTEKELTLDIAKRLNTLLKKKGVHTYMIRTEDISVDNYERAYITNMVNAKLLISVHINGLESKKFDGTMTLYCPSENSGFVGRDMADIVQKNMIKALKTVDRGLRSRPDLILLRETYMPAVIAEIACLTNKADREKLQKESFRQNAAQSLCDSVIEALPMVK